MFAVVRDVFDERSRERNFWLKRYTVDTVIYSGVTIIFGPPANIRYGLTVLIHTWPVHTSSTHLP